MVRKALLLVLALRLIACGDAREFDVAVIRPLTVIALNPSSADGKGAGSADNVRRDVSVVIQFSDNVIEKTVVDPKNVTLTDAVGTVVEVVRTYDKKTFTLTLKPAKVLAFSSEYTLRVLRGVKRATDGAVLAKEVTQTFKTEDPPALQITSISPGPGAVAAGTFVDAAGNVQPYGAMVSLSVVITFSEGVLRDSVNPQTLRLVQKNGGQVVVGTFEFQSSNGAYENEFGEKLRTDDRVVFKPAQPLPLSTDFEIRIQSGPEGLRSARATAENGWIEPREQTFAFTTANPPPLYLVQSTPSDGATAVGTLVWTSGGVTLATSATAVYGNAVSHDVVLRFSESVSTVSFLTKVRVEVADESGNPTGVSVPGTWSFSSSDPLSPPWREADTATFTPAAAWALSGNYSVIVPADLDSYRASVTAGQVGRQIRIAWEEVNPPPLYLLQSSPSDGASGIGMLVWTSGGVTLATAEAAVYGNATSHDVVLRFSESVSTGSFLSRVRVEVADETGNPTGVAVPGTWSFSSSDPLAPPWLASDTATFSPTSSWALSGNYAVIIPADLESYRATVEAGQLGRAIQIAWEEAHPPALRVTRVSPSDQSLDNGSVSGGTATYEIVIEFSESVSAATAQYVKLVDLATGTFAYPMTFDSSNPALPWRTNDQLRYVLASPLSKNYRVEIPAQVASYRATAEGGQVGNSGYSFSFDMNDPEPLVVQQTFPGHASELARDFITDLSPGDNLGGKVDIGSIMIWFSEAVDPASINSTNVAFFENGFPVFTTPASFSTAGTVVTFTPGPLNLSKTYEVRLLGSAIGVPVVGMSSGILSARGVAVTVWYDPADDSGGFLQATYSFRFDTPDPEPLLISAISPTLDASGYADNITRTAAIVLTFNEAVDPTLVGAIESDDQNNPFVHLDLGGTPVAATYTFSAGNTVLTIQSTVLLNFSTTYELVINGCTTGSPLKSWRATSAAGCLMPAGTRTLRFKTLDPAVLSIWATSPSDQEENFGLAVSEVAITATIQVLFDRPIDTATFEANFQLLQCGNTAGSCSGGTPLALGTSAFSYTSFPSGATKVTISPGALLFDTYYKAIIRGGTTGVRSLDNTMACSTSCEGGYMPGDYTVTFQTRGRPPLRVEMLAPGNNATGVPVNTKLMVRFSADVSLATLTGFSFFLTDTTTNQLVHRFGQNPSDAYYPGTFTAEIFPTSTLAYDHQYDLVLLSSIQGTDGRYLERDVRFSFHTQLATLLLAIDPYDGETGVEVGLGLRDNPGAITVYFDGAVTTSTTPAQSMSVTYSTLRGTVALRGTVSVLGGGTTWVFTPDPACQPAGMPLPYSATLYVNLKDTIWSADGSRNLAGGQRRSFSTGTSPAIAAIKATVPVPGRPDLVIDLLANTDSLGGRATGDVPILAKFRIEFTRPMNTSTLVASAVANPSTDTLLLRKDDGTYANLVITSLTGTSVEFTADDPAYAFAGFSNKLEFFRRYTIVLRDDVKDASGNPLNGDFQKEFRTSAAPRAWLFPTPGDMNTKDAKYAPAVTFSVAIAPESLTDSNFYVLEAPSGSCGGAPVNLMPALLDIGYDAKSAAVLPTPIMLFNCNHQVVLVVGANGPRDQRGNPFPGPGAPGVTNYTKNFASTANDNGTFNPAVSSRNPVSGGLVFGRGPVKINLTGGAGTNADVMPTSINPSSFWVYYDSAYTKPMTGQAYLSQSGEYAAVFVPAPGVYFQRLQTYYVRNNTYLASSLRNGCDLSCANYTIVGENTPPSVSAGPTPAGAGQPPNVVVSVTFNEAVRYESLANGIAVLDGVTPVAGTWSLSDDMRTATFRPNLPYTRGKTYTIQLSNLVLDLAGNGLSPVPSNTNFAIESSGPTVSSVNPANGAPNVSVNTTIDVTFDEPVAADTVLASLLGETAILPGSFRLVLDGIVDPLNPFDNTNTDAEVLMCPVVSADGLTVTLTPWPNALANATTYRLGVSTTVTDLGGSPMATGFTSTFSTQP